MIGIKATKQYSKIISWEVYFVAKVITDFRHFCNVTHCCPGIGVSLGLDILVWWNREGGVRAFLCFIRAKRDLRENFYQGELPTNHSQSGKATWKETMGRKIKVIIWDHTWTLSRTMFFHWLAFLTLFR